MLENINWVKGKLVMDDEMTSIDEMTRIHKMKVDKENYDFDKILIQRKKNLIPLKTYFICTLGET